MIDENLIANLLVFRHTSHFAPLENLLKTWVAAAQEDLLRVTDPTKFMSLQGRILAWRDLLGYLEPRVLEGHKARFEAGRDQSGA